MTNDDFMNLLSQGIPYTSLKRTSNCGWRTITHYGQKPISQNKGQSLENIILTGTWFNAEGLDNHA